MKIRYPLAKHYVDKNDIFGVVSALNSDYLSLGPNCINFENKIKKYAKVKYACAVSSGTAGLHLAVKALNLKPGDEVITSPFSFVSSTNCLLYENVTPVFVDIEEDTFNIDPNKIESAITDKTKAILVVHIFGKSADMDRIVKIAKKYKLKIIEDACESIGSMCGKKMTGTIGDIGVYAFFPNKQMTTGEGGMIVTNSKKYYEICNVLRNQGKSENGGFMTYKKLGYNYRMNAMSSSLGITQLEKIEFLLTKRKQIVANYNKYLKNISKIILPFTMTDESHSWFLYYIRVTNNKRSELMKKLLEKGIVTKPYFPTIHLQPYMKERYEYKNDSFPIAERISKETLALPMYIGLSSKDIMYICDVIKNSISKI